MKKILFIEDCPDLRRLLVKECSNFGDLIIHQAASSEDAFNLLSNSKYDVIVSDNNLGKESLTGIEIINKFRETYTATPVILFTGDLDIPKSDNIFLYLKLTNFLIVLKIF